MLLLFTLLLFVALDAYEITALNQFSADVDIYDMGTMGRGKNACSWHRSLAAKQEVFYYLAMQPWRHLVWTDCTGTECYKYYINEDASEIPQLVSNKYPKLTISDANDYCRKEYANDLPVFDIDWTQINEHDRLDTIDVNGKTCYKYPALQPLANIYLEKQFTRSIDVDVMIPCRFDFIGGKSITFRSFNKFSDVFISNDKTNGYLINKTRCNIDPSPNNVKTDLALILGISDTSIVQTVNNALSKLKNLGSVNQIKLYYLSGDSLKRETINKDQLAELGTKQIASGPVDALINTAKNELIARVNSKEIDRGTIVALMDRSLSSTFDAETAFDRNNITVHTVLYNPRKDNQMRIRARSLLSVGEQYHEFSDPTGVETAMTKLFIGLRTNLTERCSRMSCNGFCDGRDRCTCPMCCENTCFFTYCNTTTATCTPWPEANPKKKLTCHSDCVGKQECLDLQGCVYTEYNPGCAPRAKCMKPYCNEYGKCDQKSSCEQDKTPSYQNKCWSYKCNEETGMCDRDESGNPCPKLIDLCHEYSCDANLKCTQKAKTCVKTAPYVEMDCYKAQCNKKTGMCENVLNCNDAYAAYTGCGSTEGVSLSQCTCDAKSGFKCSCKDEKVDTSGFCSVNEICDSTNETVGPKCRESKCHQDLYKDGCQIKTCNEKTGEIEWVEYDCTKKVTIEAVANKDGKYKAEAEQYCLGKFEIVCDGGNCLARLSEKEKLEAACGACSISDPIEAADGSKTYKVSYSEDCSYLKVTCPNGKEIPGANEWYKDGVIGVCNPGAKQCVYNELVTNKTDTELCAEACFSNSRCYLATDYREYIYDREEGLCDMQIRDNVEVPECSKCKEDNTGYDLYCDNLSLDRQFNYTLKDKKYEFKYTIPKICSFGDQCIPDPQFDCSNTSHGEIGKIFALFAKCANGDGVDAVYHYSSKFDWDRYNEYRGQLDDFLKEADDQAYCTYSFKMDPCKYCTPVDSENIKLNDKCDDKKAEYADKGLQVDAFTYKCNVYADTCETTSIDVNCPPENCYYRKQKPNSLECEVTNVWTCQDHKDSIEEKLAKYKDPESVLGDKYPKHQCTSGYNCNETDHETCSYYQNEKPCEQLLVEYMENNKDFGCRKPSAKCDFDTLHCTFVELKFPENDTRFFQDRDGVVFGDNCYNYTCQEFFNTTSKEIEHHWVLTEESIIELSTEPQTICDTVYCDSETGKSVSERRKCNPISDYGLSERMAQCFECACSMQTGENVLTMRPNTETMTYELDACGNCVVRDRATGNQVNEVVECVLAQPVNLTGAIAGATVAASVVFGLIGSMVVVSIGALQTYQLVSSAMKNVISTTLENPEFVAADNEATNVLNNGD